MKTAYAMAIGLLTVGLLACSITELPTATPGLTKTILSSPTTAPTPTAPRLTWQAPTPAGPVTPLPESEVIVRIRERYKRYADGLAVELFPLSNPVFFSLFPTTQFYCAELGFMTPRYQVIANRDDRVYFMPYDFNRLILDTGWRVIEQNEVQVAQAFALGTLGLSILTENTFEEPIRIHEEQEEVWRKVWYTLKIKSWSEEGGVVKEWKFGFRDRLLKWVRVEVVDKYVGQYIPEPVEGHIDLVGHVTRFEYQEDIGEIRVW